MTQDAPVGGVGEKAEHRFCEGCGTALGPDAQFCGVCGRTVTPAGSGSGGAAAAPAAAPTPPPPPPPPPGAPSATRPVVAPVADAAAAPAGAATPWFRRRGPLLGLGAAALGIIVAVVLILVLSGGGSSGPSQAQINARNAAKQAAAAHAAAVQQATTALNGFDSAWGTETTAHNSLTNQEGSVVNAHNLGGARFILQSEANALNTMIGSVSQISFPAAAQPDARAFLTAANNEVGALTSVVSDPNDSDFNNGINSVNAANTALNGAHDLLRSDLLNATNS